MEEKKNFKDDIIHNIIIENREKINISGVEDVETFDEEKIVLATQMGNLTIEGSNLHINKLSVDSGEMIVEGDVNSLIYREDSDSAAKTGFFARLFQ